MLVAWTISLMSSKVLRMLKVSSISLPVNPTVLITWQIVLSPSGFGISFLHTSVRRVTGSRAIPLVTRPVNESLVVDLQIEFIPKFVLPKRLHSQSMQGDLAVHPVQDRHGLALASCQYKL